MIAAFCNAVVSFLNSNLRMIATQQMFDDSIMLMENESLMAFL
jgi:hypothetical protein